MRSLFLIFALLSTAAAMASDLDFVLSNQTARDFEAIYISSMEDGDWDGNLLRNGGAFPPGAKVKVRFPGRQESAKWDLTIVDDAGLSVTFRTLNLAGVDRVTLLETDGKIDAVVE
jgi:hypothetical protein